MHMKMAGNLISYVLILELFHLPNFNFKNRNVIKLLNSFIEDYIYRCFNCVSIHEFNAVFLERRK
jgi:hypothetical protein